MAHTKIRIAGIVLAGLALTATSSFADHGHRDRDNNRGDRGRDSGRQSNGRAGRFVERAAPRTFINPRIIRPGIGNVAPFRPYSYRYRPGFSLGFHYGGPSYRYYGRHGYGNGYGYGYGYGYGQYGYYPTPPAGYLSVVPGRAYGGVRIEDAPRDAQVFADGYYMGIVDDFDGAFQHMNLEAGPHRIEIRAPGYEPIAFDVRVEPGDTITYRASMEPVQQQ